ncbi:GAF domain-containing protein [uncultured Gimesia sp.]|uniref:GAF domain-containing protein n=1 Tax=uncultured Gimesia sp. TaxID=1678688 RepID=UPI0030D83B33|tara:strand:+ start:9749 stop:12823 length:3075 start_codon:yes stop_codon:yes gene_type:complete
MNQDGIEVLEQQQSYKALPDIKIVLELISKGGSLHETLTTLVEYIEASSQEMVCSILLLDAEGRLRHGAAPNLPVDYIRNIDGSKIGPNEGSCGSAAFRNQRIDVFDIATDPLWANYKGLALKHNLRACWSAPIRSSTGNVLGTFAIYYHKPCKPSPFHLRLIEQAVYLAAIAIEHSRFEESLQKSEQESHQLRVQLTEAIESLTEGFALYDGEDRLVMCNSKYREIYQESADLLVPGQRFEDHVRISAQRGQVAEAVGREEEWVQERLKQHQNPTGSLRQKLGNGHWLLISEQKTAEGGIAGVRTDITKQVLYEEELRTSINLIESIRKLLAHYITDSNPDKVFEDLLQTLLNTSDSEYGFIGEVLETEEGLPWLKTRASMKVSRGEELPAGDTGPLFPALEFFHLDRLFGQMMTSGEAMISNQPAEDVRLGGLVPNHTVDDMDSFLALPIYSQGDLIGIAGIANRPSGYDEQQVDFLKPLLVTGGTLLSAYRNEVSRKSNENALRISEERFSKIFHLNPIGKGIVDLKTGNLLDVNESFLKTTQYTREEVIGKTMKDLNMYTDPASWGEIVSSVGQNGLVYNQETVLRVKSGEKRFIDCSAWLIERAEEPLLLLMIKDITEEKQANELNRQLQIQLQHSQKMKAIGQLAAGVAHEFNNILVGINLNAELMQLTPEDEIPEGFREPLKDIQKSGERAAELVKQMLAFGRKKEPNTSWVDLNLLISNNQSIVQRILGDSITLNLELGPDTKSAWADEGEIEQALMNLVVNARDAMPAGGTLSISTQNVEYSKAPVSSELHRLPGSYSQLSVKDNGCGMSPETVEQIFEPFFTTKPATMGTGLGLSTVFRDISNTGGFISVESLLGEGTEFRIYLPQIQGNSVISKREEITASKTPTLGSGETILVCDDEAMVLSAVAALVKASGYSVIKASGPQEAIQAASSHEGKISLLLTDFNMPEMNGQQLAKQLKELDPELKVIYLTGMAGDVPESSEGAHVEVIQKPTKMEVLSQKIRMVLDRSQCENF